VEGKEPPVPTGSAGRRLTAALDGVDLNPLSGDGAGRRCHDSDVDSYRYCHRDAEADGNRHGDG
jgi:hypothetical protein